LATGVAWGRRHPLPAFVGAASVVLVGPAVVLVAVPIPMVRWWRARRSAHRAQEEIVDELPDVVDLLRLAVASGCTVRLALDAVVRHGRGRVPDLLATALDRVHRGARLADSVAALRDEVPGLAPVLD